MVRNAGIWHCGPEGLHQVEVALIYGQMTEPPGARLRVGLTGLTVAEYFRDQEGQDVLLFIDNIFRFTQAGSEVSALLAACLRSWVISRTWRRKWANCRNALRRRRRCRRIARARSHSARTFHKSLRELRATKAARTEQPPLPKKQTQLPANR